MTGQLHHIEIYVSDLQKSKEFWGWLLPLLGYKEYQSWPEGISYILGTTYIVFVQTSNRFLDPPYNRCRTGLNHLAFSVKWLAYVPVRQHRVVGFLSGRCRIETPTYRI